MNKREKEVLKSQLNSEKAVLKRLQEAYKSALDKINLNIQTLMIDESLQSKIYQINYQKALKKQIEEALVPLEKGEYESISEYLNKCYADGFIGTMYNLQGQGIPIIAPIDIEQVIQAVELDSKISEGLYTRLGHNTVELKQTISAEISRGIASAMPYMDIARNISNRSLVSFNKTMRIARTEGHRIQNKSAMDACNVAKDKGADVVKQWDSSLDKNTRKSHRKVDGEIKELDEPFSNGLMFPGDPNGKASEVINCRCALLQRAKWELDESELNTLKERAEFYGLDKADDFDDYKSKYLDATEFYRKKSSNNRKREDGNEIINKSLYSKLTKTFILNGGIIIKGEEAEKHLGKGNGASYLPSLNTSFIRDDATVSEVLEEMYHAKQDRTKMFGELSDEVYLLREIDAQKYLISMTERYKIPLREVEQTKKNLAMYEEKLEEYYKRKRGK